MKSSFTFLLFIVLFTNVSAQWVKVSGLDSYSINSMGVNKSNGFIYAVASQNNTFIGLFYKTDINSPWIQISKGLGGLIINKLEVDSTGAVYLATTGGVFYVSGNDTCINMSTGLPTNFGNYPSINCISAIDDYLYIGTNAGIFRSMTATINWQNFSQNLPSGSSANRILKYHNNILASYAGNVFRSSAISANWTGANSIANGQTPAPPTINDMAVSDSAIFIAVEGAYSNTYISWGDGMNFSPCALTMDLTAYSTFANNNGFFTGTFYGGIYSGNFDGSVLSRNNPNLPAWATVKSIVQYGSSLLAGTEYYSFQNGSGGIYYLDFAVLAVESNNIKVTQLENFVTIEWNSESNSEVERFELERKDDDLSAFHVIKTFQNSGLSHYSYNDYNINTSENVFYRLAKIGLSGEASYSDIVAVRVADSKVSLFPNPAKNNLHITFPNSLNTKKCDLYLYNSSGTLTFHEQTIAKKEYIVDISMLPAGVYFVKLQSGNYSYSQKVIVE